jgi:hypothetical protein
MAIVRNKEEKHKKANLKYILSEKEPASVFVVL